MTVLTRRSAPEFPSVFDRFFAPLVNDALFTDLAPAVSAATLAVDVSETDTEVVVRASLPGFQKDEVDVEVHDGILTIKGEHSEETEERTERFHRRERRFGSVSRSLALPSAVADDGVNAELRDGVLTVRVPKSERARPKKVAIK